MPEVAGVQGETGDALSAPHTDYTENSLRKMRHGFEGGVWINLQSLKSWKVAAEAWR